MVKDTWESRELPLLEAIAQADAEGHEYPESGSLAEKTGLPYVQVQAGLKALLQADMIAGAKINTPSGWGLVNISLRERGRIASGAWPSGDVYAELLRVLDDRIAGTKDSEQRNALQRLRGAVVDVGTGVVSAAVYDLLRRLSAGHL
jgi:hypothetical protein